MADKLNTAAKLASLLQVASVDTASAELAIEICTAVVQAASGPQRIVRVVADPVTVWGGPEQLLRLPERPVVSVASVTYNGVLLAQGTASGTWRPGPGGIWRDLGWQECAGVPSQVDVVYTHGYADDSQDIQLAAGATLSLARGLFENPSGIVREQIDDYAVAYAEAQAALDAKPSLKALLRKQYGRKAAMVRIV